MENAANDLDTKKESPRINNFMRMKIACGIIMAIAVGYYIGQKQFVNDFNSMKEVMGKQSKMIKKDESMMREFLKINSGLLKINSELMNKLQNKSDSTKSKPATSSGNGTTSC